MTMNDVWPRLEAISSLIKSVERAEIMQKRYLQLRDPDLHIHFPNLDAAKIEYEIDTPSHINLDLESIVGNAVFFVSLDNFCEIALTSLEQLKLKDTVILVFKKSFLYYSITSKKAKTSGNTWTENNLLDNTIAYIEFLEFIKSAEFCDYFNEAFGEIVIYSSSRGILKISIPVKVPDLDLDQNLAKHVKIAIQKLRNKEFRNHFKNRIFDVIKLRDQSRIETIFLKLNEIIDEAENDYDLQIKNFSFDKLKSDLRKENEKYFSTLREILNKLHSQIIGIPVSIGASTFASYKVDSPNIIILIFFAFLFYAIFALYSHALSFIDTLDIERQTNIDFDKIINDSGLPKREVYREKQKIDNKIRIIKFTLILFTFGLIILSISFSIFLFDQFSSLRLKRINIETHNNNSCDSKKINYYTCPQFERPKKLYT